MKYSIGEFSKITRSSIKALRHYHDQGLLVPEFVDRESGYRYYSDHQFYQMQMIEQLKLLGFSLKEIRWALEECEDERYLIDLLNDKREGLKAKIKQYRQAVANIELIIEKEHYAMNITQPESLIEEKIIPDMLIAGHRMKGRYDEIGKGFSLLGKSLGRWIQGPASCLYYDDCYMEENADYEAFFPISKSVEKEGVSCRNLPGGRAATILHRGPYDRLSHSYKIIMDALKESGMETIQPSREVFVKGPGMIFKGNPENYLTEIQFLIKES